MRLMNPSVVVLNMILFMLWLKNCNPIFLAKSSGAKVIYIGTPKFRLMKKFDGIVSTKKILVMFTR